MIRPVVAGQAHPPSSSFDQQGNPEGVKRLSRAEPRQHDPQLVQAAQGMEAMFLDYLMKVMRDTVPKNDMDLQSTATDIYQGMLDSEIADKAARTVGIGLADQIIDYMESPRYTLSRKPSPGTGGTHEGQ